MFSGGYFLPCFEIVLVDDPQRERFEDYLFEFLVDDSTDDLQEMSPISLASGKLK